MEVPFFRPDICDAAMDDVRKCLESGWLTNGPRTEEFEERFADYIGSEHAVAVNSCTAALQLGLEAVGVKPGDAVVVPSMTFAATAEVVLHCGAKPLFVDCRESDFNMDLTHARRMVESALAQGAKVKAIITMHYGGQIGDVEGVRALARDYGLSILCDAAHCCPAYYRENSDSEWLSVSSDADITCFSFYANKPITTGEGGMLVTNNDEYAKDARIRRLHGIDLDPWERQAGCRKNYMVLKLGYKYNTTDIASAIGIHQINRANEFHEGRQRVAECYSRMLADIDGVVLPRELPNRQHCWHLYAIRVSRSRDKIQEILRKDGIHTSFHWKPLHLHKFYEEEFGLDSSSFPVATRLANELISLPIYHLLEEDQIDRVCSALRHAIGATDI